MIHFSYLCFLLFIVIFIAYLSIFTMKRCPIKVRYFYLLILALFFSRYISLIISTLIDSQKVIYFIRPMTILSFISIPTMGLGALYIFFRDENRKFNYNYIFLFIISCMYLACIYMYKLNIEIDSSFGFLVNFQNYLVPNLIYLIMIATLAIYSLIYIDKPYSNRGGMILLTLSLMGTIAENIMFLGAIKVFPYPLFGEVLMLITTYKAINTFKL